MDSIFKKIVSYLKCNQVEKLLKVKNKSFHKIIQERKYKRLFITSSNIKSIRKEAKFYKETLSEDFLKSSQFHILLFVLTRDVRLSGKCKYCFVYLKDADWISVKDVYYFLNFVDFNSFNIKL